MPRLPPLIEDLQSIHKHVPKLTGAALDAEVRRICEVHNKYWRENGSGISKSKPRSASKELPRHGNIADNHDDPPTSLEDDKCEHGTLSSAIPRPALAPIQAPVVVRRSARIASGLARKTLKATTEVALIPPPPANAERKKSLKRKRDEEKEQEPIDEANAGPKVKAKAKGKKKSAGRKGKC